MNTTHLRTALTAAAVAGLLGLAGFVVASGPADASSAQKGATVYQFKAVEQNISLGSQSEPTILAVKPVPPGKYLVTGQIGVNTQPGSFVVCAVSGTALGNDGVFGVFTNQTKQSAEENISVTDMVTVAKKQAIYFMCDDNNGKSGNVVQAIVVEAIPVHSLR